VFGVGLGEDARAVDGCREDRVDGHAPVCRLLLVVRPELGTISLHCQMLVDLDQPQSLLVFTAMPGTEDHDRLRLLSVIGSRRLATGRAQP